MLPAWVHRLATVAREALRAIQELSAQLSQLISEVSALGVCSVYCPRGLVDEGVSLGDHSEWERALVEYEAVAIKKRTRQRRR